MQEKKIAVVTGGLPLSEGSKNKVDSDLAALAMEISGLLGKAGRADRPLAASRPT